jgi:hypothetical protein
MRVKSVISLSGACLAEVLNEYSVNEFRIHNIHRNCFIIHAHTSSLDGLKAPFTKSAVGRFAIPTRPRKRRRAAWVPSIATDVSASSSAALLQRLQPFYSPTARALSPNPAQAYALFKEADHAHGESRKLRNTLTRSGMRRETRRTNARGLCDRSVNHLTHLRRYARVQTRLPMKRLTLKRFHGARVCVNELRTQL